MVSCLLTGAIFPYGCESGQSQQCQTSANPDLINAFDPTSGTSVPQGSPYSLRNRTDNTVDPNACLTEKADPSITELIVEWRPDNFTTYDTVVTDTSSIAAIDAGDFLERNYGFIFNDPGQYRITTIADGTAIIIERDEFNNDYSDAAQAQKRPDVSAASVLVTPNPDFDPVAAGFAPGEKVKIFDLD